jgi:hypothetical protein
VTNRELDSVTQRLVYRLARRLTLIRSLVSSAAIVVGRLAVIGGLVIVGGLVVELVARSFIVNNSKSRSL